MPSDRSSLVDHVPTPARDRKKALFSRISPDQIHIATPSSWLADEVKRSPLLNRFPVSVIPNGIDIEDFAPRNQQSARDVFGIPQDANVVLFVADGIPLYRKGLGTLGEALERVAHRVPNLFLICVGHNDSPPGLRVPGIHLGFVGNDRLLSNIYSAADVFVIPSLQDNLPNTVLESMACGTPVVGFEVAGTPDMIQHGKTGLLARPHDPHALTNALVERTSIPSQRQLPTCRHPSLFARAASHPILSALQTNAQKARIGVEHVDGAADAISRRRSSSGQLRTGLSCARRRRNTRQLQRRVLLPVVLLIPLS